MFESCTCHNKTPFVRKAAGNHLLKLTYLNETQSPVSGLCYARNQECDAIFSVFRHSYRALFRFEVNAMYSPMKLLEMLSFCVGMLQISGRFGFLIEATRLLQCNGRRPRIFAWCHDMCLHLLSIENETICHPNIAFRTTSPFQILRKEHAFQNVQKILLQLRLCLVAL